MLDRRRLSRLLLGAVLVIVGVDPRQAAANTPSSSTSDGVWHPIAEQGAPDARYFHTAVWTGSEMIIWGGSGLRDDGARYNPSPDTWTPVSDNGAPLPRSNHVAVWTGSEMLVWGGE